MNIFALCQSNGKCFFLSFIRSCSQNKSSLHRALVCPSPMELKEKFCSACPSFCYFGGAKPFYYESNLSDVFVLGGPAKVYKVGCLHLVNVAVITGFGVIGFMMELDVLGREAGAFFFLFFFFVAVFLLSFLQAITTADTFSLFPSCSISVLDLYVSVICDIERI